MDQDSPPPADEIYDMPQLRADIETTAADEHAEALSAVSSSEDDHAINALVAIQDLMHWLEPEGLHIINFMIEQRFQHFEKFKRV